MAYLETTDNSSAQKQSATKLPCFPILSNQTDTNLPGDTQQHFAYDYYAR